MALTGENKAKFAALLTIGESAQITSFFPEIDLNKFGEDPEQETIEEKPVKGFRSEKGTHQPKPFYRKGKY